MSEPTKEAVKHMQFILCFDNDCCAYSSFLRCLFMRNVLRNDFS